MIVNKYDNTRSFILKMRKSSYNHLYSLQPKQAHVAPFLYLTSANESYQHRIFATSIDLQLIYQISKLSLREFWGKSE